jgi:hypothetical protein
MLRQDIKRIVEKLAKNGSTQFELMKCYNRISNYCKEHKTQPNKNTYEVKNGILYINGENIDIVELTELRDNLPQYLTKDYNEKEYYIENKILARQEID